MRYLLEEREKQAFEVKEMKVRGGGKSKRSAVFIGGGGQEMGGAASV